MLALGSLHERFVDGDKSVVNPIWGKGEGGFALVHYNKAIQQLIQPVQENQQAIDVCLIACMLFSAFETLRGHHGAAMSHIGSGVRLLSEVEARTDGAPNHHILRVSRHPLDAGANRVSPDNTQTTFQMLISPATTKMVNTKPMSLSKTWSNAEPGFCAEIPAAFSSLEEARNSMDYHWNTCITFLNEIERLPHSVAEAGARAPSVDARRLIFSNIVQQWFTAFKAFLQRESQGLDEQGLQAARILEISHHTSAVLLEVGAFDASVVEGVWDRFTSRFEQIVDLASMIVTPPANGQAGQAQASVFSLDMNIVSPLYLVAHRCRDPAIRRKAVSLLNASPRQEGVWDSYLTARAVERLILLEEEGLGPVTCAQDVPEWARITEVEVKFDLEGRIGSLGYTRAKSVHEKVREKVVYTINW
ncbi:hypothetical protein ACLMJK_001335 [Lecanora helva]